MKYVLYHNKNGKYFKDGDFITKNKNDATLLDKEKAENIKNRLNGITLNKPIEMQEI